MPHSVGVRRISSPSRVTRLGREVDGEVGGLDRGGLPGRSTDAAERGPEPGEQLVHAERLGDVVVGAGIERGDLVLFARRGPTGR